MFISLSLLYFVQIVKTFGKKLFINLKYEIEGIYFVKYFTNFVFNMFCP